MEDTVTNSIIGIPAEPAFLSALAGAIVGAIIGGLIAYFIQLKALREGRRQRAEDTHHIRKALGNSLIIKMIKIHSDIRIVHQHIEDSYRANEHVDPQREFWEYVLPIVNPLEPVYFSSEELGMLIAMNDDDVFNMVMPLDRVHHGILVTVRVHHKERATLLTKLEAESVDGNMGHAALDPIQMAKLRPQMINVNEIVRQMYANTQRGLEDSRVALLKLHKLLEDKIGLQYRLEFD